MRKTANRKLIELEEKPEHRPLTRAKRQTRHEQWREWHACLQAALVCRASLLAPIDLLAKPSALLVYAHPAPGHLPPSSSLQAWTPEQSALKLVSKPLLQPTLQFHDAKMTGCILIPLCGMA